MARQARTRTTSRWADRPRSETTCGLLPQPRGFEGALLVAVDLDTHSAASQEPVELPQGGHLHVDAGFLPAAALPHSYEHALAAEPEVLCMRVVIVEGCHPLPEESPHSVVSSKDAHVRDV